MSLPVLIRLSRERCRGNYFEGLKAVLYWMLGIPVFLLCNGAAVLLVNITPIPSAWRFWCGLGIAWCLEILVAAPIRMAVFRRFRHLAKSPKTSFRTRCKKYFSAVGYLFCKELMIGTVLILALLPAGLMTGLLRAGTILRISHGQLFGILWLLHAVLLLLGVLFFLGIVLRFFFADALWLRGECTNAFTALFFSLSLAEQKEVRLFATFFALTPYLLGCFLILPMPFCLLRLKTALAGYTDQQINDYLGGTTYVKPRRCGAYRDKGRHLDPDTQNGNAEYPAY